MNDQPVRVGVFVCDCGMNIAGTVDTAEVAAWAETLPDVVAVVRNAYTCADPGQQEIQRAIYAAAKGRTTFIITHRLSQIRWADRILVISNSEIIDQGSHEELMLRCDLYHRIFARYD